jgi:4'-phosphopantetheinyl transferase
MKNAALLSGLRLTWAGPDAAQQYRLTDLSAKDALRAEKVRTPKAQRDWQVSRVLLHACREQVMSESIESLSHSGGHALLAQSRSGWRIGVDLEKIRPRRVLALAEWACSHDEVAWLHSQPDDSARLMHFYMLWTLKEAFIKACSLSFPADLRRYGLSVSHGQPPALRAPAGAWRARSYQLEGGWVASVVWLPAPGGLTAEEPEWRAGPVSPLPAIELLGAWTRA